MSRSMTTTWPCRLSHWTPVSPATAVAAVKAEAEAAARAENAADLLAAEMAAVARADKAAMAADKVDHVLVLAEALVSGATSAGVRVAVAVAAGPREEAKGKAKAEFGPLTIEPNRGLN